MDKMLRELRQTPTVLANILREEGPRIEELTRRTPLENVPQVTFVARGSSDNACLYGKYLFESLLGVPAHLAAPSILTVYKCRLRLNNALVIAVSQSGEGDDINEYVADAVAHGVFTIALTNNVKSRLAELADFVIPLHAGPEVSVAATKTYSAQCFALFALAAAWSRQRAAAAQLAQLPEAVEQALGLEEDVKRQVVRYRYADRAVVLGRGYQYASAKELALKLMETCYLPAQAFSMADFMHGPIAMMTEGFPTFLFIARGKMERPMIAIAKQLHARRSETIIFSNTRETLRGAHAHFLLPRGVADIAAPIPYIIPAQLFAYHLSLLKGLDPDKPQHLNKITKTL